MGYERSFLIGVAPEYFSPPVQVALGFYNYAVADHDWQREKAKRQIFESWKVLVPGSLAWKDFGAVWNGTKPLSSLFFYGDEVPPQTPTWGIPALQGAGKPGKPSRPSTKGSYSGETSKQEKPKSGTTRGTYSGN
jgi:hypothetical protein